MKKATVFGFIAMLHRNDSEDPKSYFVVPFKVVAENHAAAEAQLRDYLSVPANTGLKYDTCLNLIDSSADIVLVKDTFEY